MLDTLSVRIAAGLLFAGLLLGALLTARLGGHRTTPYEAVSELPLSPLTRELWLLVSVPVPLLSLGLGAALPWAVYGTGWNFSFPGAVWLQLATFPLFAAGGLLALSSARHLGRFMVTEIARAKDHRLVSSGPYARIRHPTYLAVMLIALSAALLLLHLLLLLNFLLVVAIATRRARLEERLLASEEGLGAEYRAYMERTGRFLPRLRTDGKARRS